MLKVTFMGAGSSVFAKNVIGDIFCTPGINDSQVALYDIDATRLKESKLMLENINRNCNNGKAKISTYLGVTNRKQALTGANFVVNAIQVGGYKPGTVIDFEIPKKYGLRQTIADTLGIGGIFRGLRTIPVMMDFAHDMEQVCPNAWLLNYSNPMAILTGAMLKHTNVKTVGLCHSYQVCAQKLLRRVGMESQVKKLRHKIAGINHLAWLLEISDGGKDLYPDIKKRAERMNKAARKSDKKHDDMVRFEMMLNFGYYVTESSEHNVEYTPYFIKKNYPELVDEFNIPLDEYPRRCIEQIEKWKQRKQELITNKNLSHKRTKEYASGIINSIANNQPYQIGGNVLNMGMISNLPDEAVVEIPCLVDENGVQGTRVGALPEQCAALCRSNINVQLLTIKAAVEKKREYIYHAAMLDPHTAGELSLDDIRSMCDDLIKAHGKYLPKYR